MSYTDALAARNNIDLLPDYSTWKSVELVVPGFNTKSPLILYYRDALECLQQLLRNPLFADSFNPIPRRHYDSCGQRIITDPMSANWAWKVQVWALKYSIKHY